MHHAAGTKLRFVKFHLNVILLHNDLKCNVVRQKIVGYYF